jgi:hypothetical protein
MTAILVGAGVRGKVRPVPEGALSACRQPTHARRPMPSTRWSIPTGCSLWGSLSPEITIGQSSRNGEARWRLGHRARRRHLAAAVSRFPRRGCSGAGRRWQHFHVLQTL